MSKAPTLDGFGKLYPEFPLHKRILRAWRVDADDLWRRAFLRLSRTTEFYQRSDTDIARETTRILLAAMPSKKRSALELRLTRS